MPFAIGIDLGTTYSCAAVWKNNRVEIIANKQGRRTTPSVVAFKGSERLVGEAAKNQLITNSENTLFDAKRLIGRRFSDETVQEDMKHWPFKVVDRGGVPNLQISTGEIFAPERISSLVLSKLKEDAEAFLGDTVRDAVITCPAYFNDAQRQATMNAGRLAGLNVIRVINEPTAAAIAYGLDRRHGRSNIIIFDFGGGTLDISLMTLNDGQFEVKAVSGDTHLGGEDLNNILVDYFANDFKRKTGKDLIRDSTSGNPDVRKKAKHSLSVLRNACESVKCLLSSEASADVTFVYGGEEYFNSISRARFEELCMSTFRRCMEPLERVLTDSGMEKTDINEVVLVGGSSRIPRIQKMVSDFFGGRRLNQTVNPDEAVAYGAAIQASLIANPHSTEGPKDIVLVEVTPLSLGVEVLGEKMSVVIPRKTIIPCKKTKTFTTVSDNQTVVDFRVFEGERLQTTGNHLLGNFLLTDVPPAPKGVPVFEVTFDIDVNGILNVTAIDTKTGKRNQITITDQGRLTQEEIDRMIREGRK